MPRPAEVIPIGGAAIAALAAVLGGAFFAGPRIVVGVLLALLLGWFGWAWQSSWLVAEERLLLALLGWGVVSAVVVGMSPLAARETLAGWLVAWCLWISARRARSRAVVAGSAVLIAAALLVVAGIVLEAFGRGAIRVGGLLENPNIAACLLVAAVPLAVGTWMPTGRRWRNLVATVLVAGVVLTGSRAGLLALLAAGATLLPRGRGRTTGLVAGGVAAVAVLGWRFATQPDVLAWFRPAIWFAVLRLWAAHPVLGVGPGGLVDAAGPVRLLHPDQVGQHQFLIAYAESTPLGLLVQVGSIGLVIAVLAAALWLRGVRVDGALDSPALRAEVAVIAVMAAFHDLVTIEVVLWWWALALGLLEVPRSASSGSDGAPSGRGTRAARAMVLAFVVLWGIVQPSWARWLWRSHTRDVALVGRATAAEPWYTAPAEWRVRELLDREPWTWEAVAEALERSHRAVEANPGASRLWMDLGLVQQRVVSELGPWRDSVAGARAAFARAAELEPNQPWPWLEWARLERGLGRLDEAVALTQRALTAEPHAVRAWLFLARLELDRGETERARAALVQAGSSATLAARGGLNSYERELLAAPAWQFRELEEALR